MTDIGNGMKYGVPFYLFHNVQQIIDGLFLSGEFCAENKDFLDIVRPDVILRLNHSKPDSYVRNMYVEMGIKVIHVPIKNVDSI